jgi:hypothetical protein
MLLFIFHLPASQSPIDEHHRLWRYGLPLTPLQVDHPKTPGSDSTITYGDYFTAIKHFIERNDYTDLIRAVNDCIGRSVTERDLGTLHVTLEKHGQYYHPARLTVDVQGRLLSFVINVAVTPIGCSFLRQDFENIRLLNHRYPYPYLPQVYAHGTASAGSNHISDIEMFLGQWLDGFLEFHLSGEPIIGNDQLLVWDPKTGAQRLSDFDRIQVYRKAAQILTTYYNLETFEQIFAWHHAAGDFVLRADGQYIEVRLVTVRNYRPLFEGLGNDIDVMIHALLFFLLNLSVKMRLDRIDGVGEFVWANEDIVAATLNGFLEGLFLQVESERIPRELIGFFVDYMKSLTNGELNERLNAIFEKTFKHTPEGRMIRRELNRHTESLFKAISGI